MRKTSGVLGAWQNLSLHANEQLALQRNLPVWEWSASMCNNNLGKVNFKKERWFTFECPISEWCFKVKDCVKSAAELIFREQRAWWKISGQANKMTYTHSCQGYIGTHQAHKKSGGLWSSIVFSTQKRIDHRYSLPISSSHRKRISQTLSFLFSQLSLKAGSTRWRWYTEKDFSNKGPGPLSVTTENLPFSSGTRGKWLSTDFADKKMSGPSFGFAFCSTFFKKRSPCRFQINETQEQVVKQTHKVLKQIMLWQLNWSTFSTQAMQEPFFLFGWNLTYNK